MANGDDRKGTELPAPGAEREEGVVKWFDVVRGFGFIGRDGAVDLFVHASALEAGEVAAGDPVEKGAGKRSAARGESAADGEAAEGEAAEGEAARGEEAAPPLLRGERVSFEVAEGARGLQARAVRRLVRKRR